MKYSQANTWYETGAGGIDETVADDYEATALLICRPPKDISFFKVRSYQTQIILCNEITYTAELQQLID